MKILTLLLLGLLFLCAAAVATADPPDGKPPSEVSFTFDTMAGHIDVDARTISDQTIPYDFWKPDAWRTCGNYHNYSQTVRNTATVTNRCRYRPARE